MNHTQKKTLARKMQSREEMRKKGLGIFRSSAWESRKDAIAARVKARDERTTKLK